MDEEAGSEYYHYGLSECPLRSKHKSLLASGLDAGVLLIPRFPLSLAGGCLQTASTANID